MKKRFWGGLLLAIALNLIVFKYDVGIIQFVGSLRNSFLDYVFLSVGFASNIFIIFFFLMSLFLWKEHKRRWILPLWLASFISVLMSFIIKILVKRPRPFEGGFGPVLGIALHFMKDNFNTWNFSFPSFQAMFVFCALPILNREFKIFKHIWFIFACLVAFSRVYFGVHYFSDVLAGAIIGYLIGVLIVKIEERDKLGLRLMQKIEPFINGSIKKKSSKKRKKKK